MVAVPEGDAIRGDGRASAVTMNESVEHEALQNLGMSRCWESQLGNLFICYSSLRVEIVGGWALCVGKCRKDDCIRAVPHVHLRFGMLSM